VGDFVKVTDGLAAYLSARGAREVPAQIRCREETAPMRWGTMQVSPEQGAFLQMLAKLIGAKSYLEIGTFTGYSALSVALAMPAGGRIVTLDVDPDVTAKAQTYWQEAGLSEKIDLRLGPAIDTLDRMIDAGDGDFDFALIDGDKANYDGYYERVLTLLRCGGLVAIDNVLWRGHVADPQNSEPQTKVMRALTAKIHADARVEMALTTIGDGLLLALKR
jgi:predicted O-methyltransferase YrrM